MSTKDESSPGRRLPLFTLFIVLALLGFAVFGERGLISMMKSVKHKEELEERLVRMEEENAALRKEIRALKSDPKHIETVARKKLGLVRSDELVFQFKPEEGRAEK